MAKKPKGGKIHVYFSESDKNLYDEIIKEAEDMGRTPSRVLLGYLHLGLSRVYDENEMVCEKCKDRLNEL